MTEPAGEISPRPLVTIPITTRKPEKWLFHDLETGQVWRRKGDRFVLVPGSPQADYATAWATVTGYAQEAHATGGTIEPTELLDLLRELRREALKPVKAWVDALSGKTNEPEG